MPFSLSRLKKHHWKSIWAGNWTLLPCSDWGEHYTTTLKVFGKLFLSSVVFVFREGNVSCWVIEREIENFGRHLAETVDNDLSKVNAVSKNLMRQTDIALHFMQEKQSVITIEDYQRYLKIIRDYYTAHVFTKYLVDNLDQKFIHKSLPILQKARVYAEPVFSETIQFDQRIARQINQRTGLDTDLALFLTKEEVILFFNESLLPSKEELKERRYFSVLIFQNGFKNVYVGIRAEKIEKALFPSIKTKILKGSSAYGGKVKGIVKVVLDPQKSRDFKEGDILVTSMTRPEYLPLIQKAAALVTDAGGILSHAAITARELKKPCIIGTKVATKTFKDGDIVEVDANIGVVRKIK